MTDRYFENRISSSEESVSNASREFWKQKIAELTERVGRNALSSLSPSKNTVYTGTAGIAYMFYRLAVSDEFKKDSATYLNRAIKVLAPRDGDFSSRRPNGFLSGDAGVNAVNAAIRHLTGDVTVAELYLKRFIDGGTTVDRESTVTSGQDELFVGRAGYLYGVLWLEKVFGRKIIPDQDIIDVCSKIVQSGREYSKKNKSVFPLMYSYHDKEYLGAAHGLCTILQVLISFPRFIEKQQQTKQDIKKCVDILTSLQTVDGNFPTKTVKPGSKQRPEKDELVHWCHGAPGVVYLLAKAYLVFKEPSYLECCLKCGDLVWKKGLLKKGPGICHGIAGNGYVFLLLYRLTGDKKHLNRAMKFGEFIFTDEFIRGSRRPDNLYSLYEGLAGTACYLIDLTQPEKANFPFLDVF